MSLRAGRDRAQGPAVLFLVGLLLAVVLPVDPAAASVAPVPARLPEPLQGAGVAAAGDAIYLFGGETCSGSCESRDTIMRFDAANGTVEEVATRLPQVTTFPMVVWMGDAALVLGGAECLEAGCPAYSSVYRYEPAGEGLTVLAPLPTAMLGAAAVWDGDSVYLFGGIHCWSVCELVDTIMRYDPATGVSENVSRLPFALAQASAIWTDEAAYLFGGTECNDVSCVSDRIVRFEPDSGHATLLDAALPGSRIGAAAVWTGAQAFVLGGAGCGPTACGTSAMIFSFEPGNGTVAVAEERLPAPIMYGSAVWDGAAAYLLGGGQCSVVCESSDEIVKYRPFVPAAPLVNGRPGPGTAEVTLSWVAADSPNVIAYVVERSAGGGSFEAVAEVDGNTTEYVDGGLVPSSTYRYRITAWNAAGHGSDPSNEVDVKAPVLPTSLDGEADMFPDPLEGEVCGRGAVQGLVRGFDGLAGRCDATDDYAGPSEDRDADAIPDAVEPVLCALENQNSDADGHCDDGDGRYHAPPV